jgi:fumarate hydratase subunit beta
MKKFMELPLTKEDRIALKAGEWVYLTGTVYTARDAAHKRICAMIEKGETLPFPLKDQIIYYAGPCPAMKGQVIGSCGPTTSGRMDAYAPTLLNLGLGGMIGKGGRNPAVIEAMKRNSSLYFAATGGAGAYLSNCVTACEVVAFHELLAEAVYKLEVVNFPVLVAIDTQGKSVYARECI